MYPLLDTIKNPAQIREFSVVEMQQLSNELRQFLIDTVLKSGGHFSGNLGVVELTIALHHFLDFDCDKLVWDVGHQSYPHKILTGRMDGIKTIRQKGGLSGFPNLKESEYDHFGTGHSSSSISAVLGMAMARSIQGISAKHVAVIGDGSLTGGMAWEALNNAGVSGLPITIVLNDNNIGIDPNQGAIDQYLRSIGERDASNIFSDWGFEYALVEDGHDLNLLLPALRAALGSGKPYLLHVKTVKGKGFAPAEEEQTLWHAVKYVKVPGKNESENGSLKGPKFQDSFGRKLLEMAKKNKDIVAITPAMPSGSSLNYMMDEIPERVFDVGIAEQHAVTFSAGLAVSGLKPFCNIYSSFFQRGYDQYIHDICLQNLNVTFFLDRAGIVGGDGPTHHGLYDLAFLRCLPNTSICAPLDSYELEAMMDFAEEYSEGPIVIRYPRGRSSELAKDMRSPLEFGKGRKLENGSNIAILSIGSIGDQALRAHQTLQEQGLNISVYDMRFVRPLDVQLLKTIATKYMHIICLENGTVAGGFGSSVLEALNEIEHSAKIHLLGFPLEVVPHAKPRELFKMYGLDDVGIADFVKRLSV